MHIVFHRRKKSFLIIEMKVRHCITLQKKNTEKTIILYIKLSDLMLLDATLSLVCARHRICNEIKERDPIFLCTNENA